MKDDKDLVKLKCINNKYEVFHNEEWMCCFGNYALILKDDCNINYNSWSLLDNDYECPFGDDKFALAESHYFKVLEFEVYKFI